MSYLKEPGYFADKGAPNSLKRPFHEPGGIKYRWYKNDLDSYLELFSSAKGADIIGESSTAYSQRPHRDNVAQRIRAFRPDARIIYVMRDPIERAISHYWWNVQHEGESRGLLDALRDDSRYIDTSYYAMQLEPYLSMFDRSRVMCMTMESLASHPAETLSNLFRWLEIDPSHVPPKIGERKNVTPSRIVRQNHSSILQQIRFSNLWGRVGWCVPKGIRSLARRFVEQPVDRNPHEESNAIDYLRPIALLQTRELCCLLEREFPEWRTLSAVPANG